MGKNIRGSPNIRTSVLDGVGHMPGVKIFLNTSN